MHECGDSRSIWAVVVVDIVLASCEMHGNDASVQNEASVCDVFVPQDRRAISKFNLLSICNFNYVKCSCLLYHYEFKSGLAYA